MPKKILVVEDDREVAGYIADFLKAKTFDAKCAYDGDEAVKSINEYKPDCILLDVQLPGSMNGINILEQTKKTNPNIKIVVITGFVEEETEQECTKLGADGYIIKPLDFRKVGELIKEIMGKQK